MGREVRRVPLDFEWPIRKVWDGYINHHYVECTACKGRGQTTAMDRLRDLVGLIMLSGEDAHRRRAHPYFHRMEGLHNTAGNKPPSKDMVALTTGLAEREPGSLGHDAIDGWRAAKKIIAAAGLPETWGLCEVCKGESVAPEHKAAYDAWERTPPPDGEGWQMWETTTEGSPISPVFKTPEALAEWLADSGASSFGSSTATYSEWLRMIRGPGWAPSMVIENGLAMGGVEAAARHTK